MCNSLDCIHMDARSEVIYEKTCCYIAGKVFIKNTGDSSIKNLVYAQNIFYNSNSIVLGSISDITSGFKIEQNNKRNITIKGGIEEIQALETVSLEYIIPISKIMKSGAYSFVNKHQLSKGSTLKFWTTDFLVKGVSLDLKLSCNVNLDNTGEFIIHANSNGNTSYESINIEGDLMVPPNIELKITNLQGLKTKISKRKKPSDRLIHFIGKILLQSDTTNIYRVQFTVDELRGNLQNNKICFTLNKPQSNGKFSIINNVKEQKRFILVENGIVSFHDKNLHNNI